MRVIVPTKVTAAMVVSSTLVEVPPAMHSMAASYGKGATASTGVVGGVITVWKSLQANNVGHEPVSGSTWWQSIGTTYSVYDPNHAYALNDRVIDLDAHLVCESRINGANQNQKPGVGTAWLVLGPSNKWAAFDDLRNTQAEAPVDIVQEIQLTERANAIAVIGLDGRTVTIKQTVNGVEKYSVTANLSKRKSVGWKAWYFDPFESRTSVQYYDLPPYRKFSPFGRGKQAPPLAGARVGGIVIGNAVYIGEAQYEATSDHLNFSTVERDKAGNLTLNPERSVPKVDLQVWFDKSLTSQIMKLREQLNGRPAIWSGLDDFTLDFFEPFFIFGIHKEFNLNLKDFDHGLITLQVEEM